MLDRFRMIYFKSFWEAGWSQMMAVTLCVSFFLVAVTWGERQNLEKSSNTKGIWKWNSFEIRCVLSLPIRPYRARSEAVTIESFVLSYSSQIAKFPSVTECVQDMYSDLAEKLVGIGSVKHRLTCKWSIDFFHSLRSISLSLRIVPPASLPIAQPMYAPVTMVMGHFCQSRSLEILSECCIKPPNCFRYKPV